MSAAIEGARDALASLDVSGRVSEFRRWWVASLEASCPRGIRERLFLREDLLHISVLDDGIQFRLTDEWTGIAREALDLPGSNAGNPDTVRQWLALNGTGPMVAVMMVDDSMILRRTVTLPASTERDLRSVLELDMDRITPFLAGQVCFDFMVVERDQDNDNVRVELVLIRRDRLEALLEQARSWGLEVGQVTGDGVGLRLFNLLPGELRPARRAVGSRSTQLLAATCLATLLLALYVPLLNYRDSVQEWRERVRNSELQSAEAVALKASTEQDAARAGFLRDKRSAYVPRINILRDLTAMLPDGTWIERIGIDGMKMELRGESEAATSVLQTLESSRLVGNARFTSPVTRNELANKDRFQVSAEIRISEAP